MHILFLTWKDIKHPHIGGAEQVMLEYARGLVERGHRVTWFASSYPGALPEEEYEGIHIIRRYTNHTIWMLAWWWYRTWKKTNSVDIIIDEAGGWPLLSPLYEKQIPIYFFVHHIGDREFYSYPFPISTLSRFVYRTLIRVYKNTRTIAVSNSTRDELAHNFGFDMSSISVIDNTTEIIPIGTIPYDTRTNNILFFGRITAIKRADHAIRAFHSVIDILPQGSELHLIGNAQDKQYVDSIQTLIDNLGIRERVRFLGYISRDQFTDTLTSYRCMLVPSEKEGYGLVVIECNAHGLPAIGYDVAGLRDSIEPGVNGILVPDGDYIRMGQAIVDMLANDANYRTLCENSLQHVSTIPKWSEQVDKLEALITKK